DFYAHMFGLHHLCPDSPAGTPMCGGNHCETRPVDVVMGAFLLLRRTVFEGLGGFDERFFVYYEEVDLLWQVHRAGWQSYYLSSVHAMHKGGGCSSQARAARLFFSLRSRILYSRKHFCRASALCLTLATLLIEPFSRIVYAAGRRRAGEAADTLKACLKLWIWLIRSLSPGSPGSMQASAGTDLLPEK
ncbi:MAG TPA: hypothetical protein VFU27_07740, partial [Terriglobales bacterium]|nr:hypothetical protein [Terriglobales bacterium]